MAVYVIAVAAFAVMLYASFRSLAMQPAGGADHAAALGSLVDNVASGSRDVANNLALTELSGHLEVDDALTAGARAGRKRLAAYEQQLARVEGGEAGPELRRARDLVASAVEDLSWACRLVESPGYSDSGGLQEAASGLAGHARRCLDEVRRLRPEPG
ncbi:MAG: hypothetical protein ABR564_06595 [Candidatus Dormibacteria bacterium]